MNTRSLLLEDSRGVHNHQMEKKYMYMCVFQENY